MQYIKRLLGGWRNVFERAGFFGCPVLAAGEGRAFRSHRRIGSPHSVDPNQTRRAPRIERETAPRPVARMRNEAAFHRIEVHVVQLLDLFLVAPDIEIVEAELPEAWQRKARAGEAQRQLRG